MQPGEGAAAPHPRWSRPAGRGSPTPATKDARRLLASCAPAAGRGCPPRLRGGLHPPARPRRPAGITRSAPGRAGLRCQPAPEAATGRSCFGGLAFIFVVVLWFEASHLLLNRTNTWHTPTHRPPLEEKLKHSSNRFGVLESGMLVCLGTNPEPNPCKSALNFKRPLGPEPYKNVEYPHHLIG